MIGCTKMRAVHGMIQATDRDPISATEGRKNALLDRRILYESALLFVAAGLILFLFSSRVVSVFDEGILLTGTMRTMAGQVPHRDFNYNYGPAQLYFFSALFKLFGPSVLAERLAAIASNCCLVVSLYLLSRKLCGRLIAVAAAIVCMLWLIGLGITLSWANAALCMLTLWTSWLILPVSDSRVQRRRALVAGFFAAMMFVLRYDLGVGTVAANLVAMPIMTWLQKPGESRSTRWLLRRMIGPYLAAFVITVTPAAIAYLSVAPLHDLLYDVVIYMAKYFRLGRALPFPRIRPGVPLGELALYLLPIIILLGLWLNARYAISRREKLVRPSEEQTPEWMGLLASLSIAAAMICLKGLVRVGLGAMYGSVIGCVLLGAVLFQHRAALNIWLRGLLLATLSLFGFAAACSATAQVSDHGHLRPLVINWLLTPGRQPPRGAFRSWCHDDTPITKGLCFLLDDDHIQAIRYLDAHTRPGDYLYVGLDHHDRIFANDMITYFATQRLPAVKWTEMDPFLENRADIQQEMIGTIELHKPPYVVLDSEFDHIQEPNGSSVHTGVHLLDDYIAAHYKTVEQYGELTILQRHP